MHQRFSSRVKTVLGRPVWLLVSALSFVRRWILGPHAIGVLYESENGTLISGVGDMFVGGTLGFRGRYQMDTLNSLLALLTPQSRVLVIGSHVGAFAIPLSRKVREVIAYEANPNTFRLLQYNLKLNRIDNLEAYNLAVGDRPGKIDFFASSVNSGGSGCRFDPAPGFMTRSNRIEVEMVRLADHIADPQFDLVLMDIEGSECFAFRGMQPILAACSYLQFEYLPPLLRKSGVSDKDLVSALGENFAEIRIQGTEIRALQGDFLELFNMLRRENKHVDLLALTPQRAPFFSTNSVTTIGDQFRKPLECKSAFLHSQC